jgi:hypothetical protein
MGLLDIIPSFGGSSRDKSIGPPLKHSNAPNYEYVACYTDSDDRALPFHVAAAGADVNRCHQAAVEAGSSHFGLQNGDLCFISNGEDEEKNYAKYGAGDPWYCSRDINGSEWINQVYRVVNPTAVPNTVIAPAKGIPPEPIEPLTCASAESAVILQGIIIERYTDHIADLEKNIGENNKLISEMKMAIAIIQSEELDNLYLRDAVKRDILIGLRKLKDYKLTIKNLENNLATANTNLAAARTKLTDLNTKKTNFCRPYDNTNKITDTSNPAIFTYEGCFRDTGFRTKATITTNTLNDLTVAAECRYNANIAGARYFGLRNHGECWLSDDDKEIDLSRYGKGIDLKCYGDKKGEDSTDHVYKIKTNEELNFHDDNNTKTNNKDYDYYEDGGTGKYNYVGCWAKDAGQGLANEYVGLPNPRTGEQTNRECYKYAYANNKKYYGLTADSKCWTSNGAEEDYKKNDTKGFTRRCLIGGGIDTNQVYELSYTKSQETAKMEELEEILKKAKSYDGLITNILDAVTKKNTAVGEYTSSALTALNSGNAKLDAANADSIVAFNNSALALQNAEKARRLFQNLEQQVNASQIAATVRQYSQNSIDNVASTNTKISEAQTNYSIVITNNNLVNGETANISDNIATAASYLKSAKDVYDAFKSNFLSASMRAKMNEIEVLIGPQTIPLTTLPAPNSSQTALTGIAPIQTQISVLQASKFKDIPHTQDNTTQDLKIKENFVATLSIPEDIPPGTGTVAGTSTVTATPTTIPKLSISISSITNTINNFIKPNVSLINGYAITVTTVKNPQITSIQNIISQSTTGSSLASGNASEIIAQAALEIARTAEIKTLETNQQAQLAKADAAQAAEIQAQIDAANAKKAKLNSMAAKTRATAAQLSYERQLVQTDTINKQIDLMNKLNRDVLSVNDTTTIEGFTNPLPTVNNQEIDNYVNTFNTGLSLLNDPNNMTKVAFDTYIHIQNKKLDTLSANLDILNSKASLNTNTQVKGLRSINNSAILNVEEYPDPKKTTPGQNSKYTGNGSPNYPNYLIYGNNGCLQYEKSTTETPATWDFKSCNAKDPRQQFTMNKITNLQQYNKPITSPNNKSYKINNESNVNFGFYTVTPNNVADQCLQLNNDGISVMPCNMDSSQRFGTNYNTVL